MELSKASNFWFELRNCLKSIETPPTRDYVRILKAELCWFAVLVSLPTPSADSLPVIYPLPHLKHETRGFFSFQTPLSPSLIRKVRWRGLSSLPTPSLAWNARWRGPSLPSHWISKLCPSGHGFDVRHLSTETTPRQACHPPDLWQGTGLGQVPPTQPVPVPPKPIPGFPHGFPNLCCALQHLWFPGAAAYITRIECAVNMLIVFHSSCFP